MVEFGFCDVKIPQLLEKRGLDRKNYEVRLNFFCRIGVKCKGCPLPVILMKD